MLRRPLSGAVVAACAAAAAVLVPVSTPASAAARTRPGAPRAVVAAAAPRVRGATALGALPGTAPLDLRVVLRPRDPAALAAFVSAVSTPGSPEYRRYLRPGQFSRRFGPSAATIRAVRSWLRSAGLEPGPVSSDGLLMSVRTDAASAARAFGTRFSRVRLPGGRVAFANDTPATVAARVSADVTGVVGLDDVGRPHAELAGTRAPRRPRTTTSGARATSSTSSRSASAPAPCTGAAGTASTFGGYTADQLASAYGLTYLYGHEPGLPGAAQTVALYELEPYSASDISAYQACYGTSAAISNVTVDGGAGSGSGAGEAALDIETLVGLAPAVTVNVYEAPNTPSGALDDYARIVDDDTAQVVSTSWGICEPQAGAATISAEASLFQQAAAQGQTVLAASGDDGSEDCVNSSGVSTGALSVDDPGSQPDVTSVGGTDLTALGAPPTQPPAESVWNDPSFGASGGGISNAWSMPSWQSGSGVTGIPSSLSSGAPCGSASGYCREVPDVSASADPQHGYVVYFSGQWGIEGGASAGPPLWSALVALLDQGAGRPAGFLNPALYQKTGNHTLQLNDVTDGNNDLTGTNNGLYPATPGYDMATGLGTPVGCSLATAFGVPGVSCAAAAAGVSPTLSTLAAGPSTVPADGSTTATVTVTLVDGSGSPISGKTVTLGQGSAHSVITPAAGQASDSSGRAVFQVSDGTPETVAYTATDTTDGVVVAQTATVGFAHVVSVAAGGTAASAAAGTVPGPADPLVVSVTSPGAGQVGFTPTDGPGSLSGFDVTPFGMTITAPPASASAPLSITFQAAMAGFPPGTGADDVSVLEDGAPVAACSSGSSSSPQASPDPCQAAVSLSGGVLSITVLSSHASSWTLATPLAVRLAGADREATAVAVSQAGFAPRGAGAVVLARDDTYPDALAGAALAAATDGPVLLTSPGSLDAGPSAEIQRVLPAGGTVYLLGGTAALSDQVQSQVAALGFRVARLAGSDRYGTAVAVADAVSAAGAGPSAVLLTTGLNFPDALAAAAATGTGQRVVLLTAGSSMPSATAGYLGAHPGYRVYAVGGPAAAADPGATAIVGSDRYGTAAQVAHQLFSNPVTVGLATGLAFPDALAAGPRLARLGVPLLLTDPGTLSSATDTYLVDIHTIDRLEAYGGTAAVSDGVLQAAEALLNP